jgi:hypothetical protein
MRWSDIPGNRVEDEHNAAIHHVPLVPSEVVDDVRDEVVVADAERGKHGLLPETPSAKVCRECVDDAECEDALNRPGDDGEGKLMGVVLVPRLNVEGQKRCTVLACRTSDVSDD